jgi:hypothetical protein
LAKKWFFGNGLLVITSQVIATIILNLHTGGIDVIHSRFYRSALVMDSTTYSSSQFASQKPMPKRLVNSKHYASIYLVCFLLSVVISWGIFAQFLGLDNASVGLFFQQAFANPAATLVSSDVILSAVILWIFVAIESNRLGMPVSRLWLAIAVTCSVGVCGALSLFLWQRDRWQQGAIANPT